MRTFVVSLEPSRASALDLERVLVDDEWLALESTLNLNRGGAGRLDTTVPYGQNAKRVLWQLFPELKEQEVHTLTLTLTLTITLKLTLKHAYKHTGKHISAAHQALRDLPSVSPFVSASGGNVLGRVNTGLNKKGENKLVCTHTHK